MKAFARTLVLKQIKGTRKWPIARIEMVITLQWFHSLNWWDFGVLLDYMYSLAKGDIIHLLNSVYANYSAIFAFGQVEFYIPK